MSFRPIPVVKLDRKFVPPKGRQPAGVVWLKLDQLAVDTRYQRELGDKGVSRVRAIAIGFDWRKFTPLIVSQASDGYAVIDGQHRAAAALARGDIEAVPCWVIEADVAGQAETFLSINAEAARVPSGAMWHARAAAGDPKAVQLFAVCAKAGVEILKWPVAAERRHPHQTLAPAEIGAMMHHGEAVVIRALETLRKAGELGGYSLLAKTFVRAAVLLTKHDASWRAPQIHVALGDLHVQTIEARAAIAAREHGGARGEHVVKLLREHAARRAVRAVA